MRGLIHKIRILLGNLLLSTTNAKTQVTDETHTAVILNETKTTVQIACWYCGRHVWVIKGARCHKTGLCSACLNNRRI